MPVTSIIIILLLLLLCIGSLKDPLYGIVAYLIVFMIYSKTSWWLQPVVAYVPRLSLVMLVFIVLGCVMHAGSLDWKIAKIEKELYVFLGIVWIVSLFFGLDLHSGSWMYLDKLTKSFFFIFLLLRVVHSIERYNLVLWTFVLGGSFLALQAIFVGGYTDSRLDTIGGVDFNEANAFSAFLSIGVVVLAFKMLNAPVVKKIFYVLTVALMLNVIILAQSRAVFMGLVLAFAYVLIFSPKIYRKRIIIYMLLGIMMFFVLVDKSFLERMSTIKTHLDQGQLAQLNDSESEELSRFDFWRASIKIFKDHPLGIGVKNFEKTVSIYDPRNPGLDAHNTYVLCYAEIGILGILMFLFLIYEIFMQMRRIRQRKYVAEHQEDMKIQSLTLTTILIIYFFGYMLTHSILYSQILWILFALPLCLDKASLKHVRRELP